MAGSDDIQDKESTHIDTSVHNNYDDKTIMDDESQERQQISQRLKKQQESGGPAPEHRAKLLSAEQQTTGGISLWDIKLTLESEVGEEKTRNVMQKLGVREEEIARTKTVQQLGIGDTAQDIVVFDSLEAKLHDGKSETDFPMYNAMHLRPVIRHVQTDENGKILYKKGTTLPIFGDEVKPGETCSGPTHVEILGQGGMGTIYKYRDNTGEDVAVKLARRNPFDGSWLYLDNLKVEAVFQNRLKKQGVCPVHYIGNFLFEGEWVPGFAMKIIKGKTLLKVLQERSQGSTEYTLPGLLDVFKKVSETVAYAHSREIIHRDLKPENIMIGDFGEVLVMDWGLTKYRDDSDQIRKDHTDSKRMMRVGENAELSLDMTLVGQSKGTPSYMSPEQLRGDVDNIDEKSDIYALGLILYEILTCRRAVPMHVYMKENEGGTQETIIESFDTFKQRRIDEEYSIVPPREVGDGVPDTLEKICMGALKKDKKARTKTAKEIVETIARYIEKRGNVELRIVKSQASSWQNVEGLKQLLQLDQEKADKIRELENDDSPLAESECAVARLEYLDLCVDIVAAYRALGQVQKVIEALNDNRQRFDSFRAHYLKREALALKLDAFAFQINGKDEEAIPVYEQAGEIYEEIDETRQVADIIDVIINCHFSIFSRTQEEIHRTTGLELCDRLEKLMGDDFYRAISKRADFFKLNQETQPEAIALYHQAVSIAENPQIDDRSFCMDALYCIGGIHHKRGELQEAIPVLEKAMQMAVDTKDQLMMAAIPLQQAEVYYDLGDKDKGELLMKESLNSKKDDLNKELMDQIQNEYDRICIKHDLEIRN